MPVECKQHRYFILLCHFTELTVLYCVRPGRRANDSFYMRTAKLIFLCLSLYLTGGWPQSLRPTHWSEEHISFLQARGYLWNISPLARPVTASDLAQELVREFTSPTTVSAIGYERSLSLDKWLSQRLGHSDQALVAAELDNSYWNDTSAKTFRGVYRLQTGATLRPWLELYNTMVADTRLDNQPDYLGFRENGYARYTEQAYLQLQREGVLFKVGRDYLRLGPGRDASLLISDYSRPLDQLMFSYKNRLFQYTFCTASLDASRYPVLAQPSQQSRYVSLHRLEIRPWRLLAVAVQEAMLFGGAGAGYNFAFWNPFIFLHPEQMNGPQDGNTLLNVQFSLKPQHHWLLYGDLLIDDIQLENSSPVDREPDEYGMLVGVDIADPFWLAGLDAFAEYTRITNRTFNSTSPWEKWLHRQQPLAHYLGNDFDRMLVGFQYWPVADRRWQASYEHRRQGQGTINSEFDEPWLLLPDGQSYHEPFPTGVVQAADVISLTGTWQPRWWFKVSGRLEHWDVTNFEHHKGQHRSYWQGRCGIYFEWVGRTRWDNQ
jgi:hypothetical protein